MSETGSRPTADRIPELSADELMREQRLQRNLKIVIAAMSFMIVAGLAAMIIRIMMGPSTPTKLTQPSPAVATPAGDISLEIPNGAKVVSVSLAGNRLAVHYDGPLGTGIAVIDLESGKRLVDVKTFEAAPRP